MTQPKITDIRLIRLDYNNSIGYWNLIRVDSNEGVWGLGEAYWGPGLHDVINEFLKPKLVGKNPMDIDYICTYLRERLAGIHTANGLIMAAISGIEIALWDLAGKLSGLPVYRLLGGPSATACGCTAPVRPMAPMIRRCAGITPPKSKMSRDGAPLRPSMWTVCGSAMIRRAGNPAMNRSAGLSPKRI